MAGNGLWASMSCEEVPDGKGGVDINVKGATKPVPEQNGSTTTTTINGVMHADGRVEGEVVLTHNGSVQSIASTNGTGMRTVPFVNEKGDVPLSEEARDALSGPAKACKTGLGLVRGVSG